MKKVLAVLPDESASSVLTVLNPLRHLAQQGKIQFDETLEAYALPSQVAWADVIVACRNMQPLYRPIFELALQLTIPIIYVLDDNLFAVPEEDAFSQYYHHPDRQAQLAWILQHASLVRVHSPVLANVVRPYNAHVKQVYAAVDWALVPETLPILDEHIAHMVYATSRTEGDPLFALIQPALEMILEQFGDRVRLHLLGASPNAEIQRFPQVIHHPFERDYVTFFQKFTRAGYTIGLAPMLDDLFYQCKTDVKFRDYASAGVAGIYSDSPLYSASVIHEQTGLLVPNETSAWVTALRRYIQSPELVQTVRENAKQVALTKYALTEVTQAWLADLESMPDPAPTADVTLPQRWTFTRSSSPLIKFLQKTYQRLIPFEWRIKLLNLRSKRP